MTDSSGPVPEDMGDRQAIEHILGRPLSQAWPAGALAPGSRVTVVRDQDWDGPWQVEFLGTIDAMGAPEPNTHAQALRGELLYWVTFDESQYDCDGAGPYRKAQIWGRYLRAEQEPEV
ncbi:MULTISPECIES: ferrous iron transport protein A [Streptomyces]|uniref:Ferrous iron transport protein A n=1 Tax=Streptomyces yangpuensis TaxID=1648182 RepID=A0ABY5Q446_9ACTN|nr:MULTISPECIES: ferrous iron transport protein A [Streptomyces]UUY51207.1 ferrous iron transport protein A [Streptomyces yangpuensis]